MANNLFTTLTSGRPYDPSITAHHHHHQPQEHQEDNQLVNRDTDNIVKNTSEESSAYHEASSFRYHVEQQSQQRNHHKLQRTGGNYPIDENCWRRNTKFKGNRLPLLSIPSPSSSSYSQISGSNSVSSIPQLGSSSSRFKGKLYLIFI
ncbi:uncharacterized protein LOC128386806 [Panonychus citri]|uniref:uncharacterized protein LOC128386806 n=1 Tax=Panonychus citri TaxID=50023 RepID=UPI002307521F|nr:uncharacterized protein LOC128386806 [Panonychus citri]